MSWFLGGYDRIMSLDSCLKFIKSLVSKNFNNKIFILEIHS